LILYINSPVLTNFGTTGETGLYELTFSGEQFTEIHKNVLSEIGSRYGEKLAGYWFDSWYQSLAACPDVPIEAAYRYCKVGNPCRITAFNFWIFPILAPWQDYWAGELYALQNPFESRYIQRGAGAGFQAHGMVSMLPSWVHQRNRSDSTASIQHRGVDRTPEGQGGTPSRHDDQHRNLPGRHD